MKWIKATERVPSDDDHVPLKIDGCSYRTGNFYKNEEGEIACYVFGVESYTVTGEKLEGIEWLDESEDTKCDGNCGMNYCDEYGCIDRKRNLVEPDSVL